MKNYKEQKDLKCCLNCKFSKMQILPDENELFCYETEVTENIDYVGICDNFDTWREKQINGK